MTVSLPSISSLFRVSVKEEETFFPPSPAKSVNDNDLPPLQIPLPTPKGIQIGHTRRVSTCSTSSAPSLTYSPSPSPSPPPTRPASPEPFLLVPCPMELANAVVIVPNRLGGNRHGSNTSPSTSPSTQSVNYAPPVFRPCRPSEARALLLIGPAISAHARKSSVRMHPYRIIRDRRV